MINIRKDLIEKELSDSPLAEDGRHSFRKFHLHNSFIERLYHQYDCVEMVENFYDSEPDFDAEEYNMYLDYSLNHTQNVPMNGTTFYKICLKAGECEDARAQGVEPERRFCKEEHTPEELEQAYQRVKAAYEKYQTRQIEFCNWQEPYFEGNWDMTQECVDRIAIQTLKRVRKVPVSKQERLYMMEQDGYIHIYVYLRDYEKVDYWFIFRRRNTKSRSC